MRGQSVEHHRLTRVLAVASGRGGVDKPNILASSARLPNCEKHAGNEDRPQPGTARYYAGFYTTDQLFRV